MTDSRVIAAAIASANARAVLASSQWIIDVLLDGAETIEVLHEGDLDRETERLVARLREAAECLSEFVQQKE